LTESQKLEWDVSRTQAFGGVDFVAQAMSDTPAVQIDGQRGGVKGPADVVNLEVALVKFAVVALRSELDRTKSFELLPSPPVGKVPRPESRRKRETRELQDKAKDSGVVLGVGAEVVLNKSGSAVASGPGEVVTVSRDAGEVGHAEEELAELGPPQIVPILHSEVHTSVVWTRWFHHYFTRWRVVMRFEVYLASLCSTPAHG